MKTRPSSLLFFLAILLILSACSSRARKYPPYQTKMYTQQTSDTARQNVMVADMQLAQSKSYYQKYTAADPVVSQAVQKYDQGNVVVNIYQFDVADVGSGDMEVVYGGTQTIANGDDMVMAAEIGAVNDQEARIRYMLADMQLGSVADYYRQFKSDPAIAEALKRWDAGVRVSNIDQFERRILVQAGWKVLYKGTDTPIQGMDVALTSDESQPAATSGSSATEEVKALCAKNNPMMKPGSSWTYEMVTISKSRRGVDDWNESTFTHTLSVSIDENMVAHYVVDSGNDNPLNITRRDCENPPYFAIGFNGLESPCWSPDRTADPVWNGNTLSCAEEFTSDNKTNKKTVTITFDPVIGLTGAVHVYEWDNGDGVTTTTVTLTGSNLGSAPAANPASGQPESCSTEDGRIRYILADIQLGGGVAYYQQFTASDQVVAQAVQKWDAGVRLQNPSAFERRSLDNAGWAITYAGTDTRVNCSDIQLSGEEQSQPPQGQWAACHKYFPAVQGFTWNYDFHMDVTNGSTSDSIQSVTQNGDNNYTLEVMTLSTSGARANNLTCSPNGVFNLGDMILPAESNLVDGYTFQNGDVTHKVGFETVTVPAGTFNALRLCVDTQMGPACDYYAEGIGLVETTTPEYFKQLTSYHSP